MFEFEYLKKELPVSKIEVRSEEKTVGAEEKKHEPEHFSVGFKSGNCSHPLKDVKKICFSIGAQFSSIRRPSS